MTKREQNEKRKESGEIRARAVTLHYILMCSSIRPAAAKVLLIVLY